MTPNQGVKELADRQPAKAEGKNPDHHEGEGRGEDGEEGGAGDGGSVFQEAASAPGYGLAQQEANVKGQYGGGKEEYGGAGHPLNQDLHHRPGEMAEGDAKVAGYGVLQVD